MPSLGGNQEHHLGTSECRQFVGLQGGERGRKVNTSRQARESTKVEYERLRSAYTYFLHEPRFPLAECRVPPELVLDVLHLDPHTTAGLLRYGLFFVIVVNVRGRVVRLRLLFGNLNPWLFSVGRVQGVDQRADGGELEGRVDGVNDLGCLSEHT